LKTIKYQYAERNSGELIHIDSIKKGVLQNERYICASCRQELIPKIGNIRVHHFSHKNDVYNCSKETYLHELGKKIFYETFLQCKKDNIPFYIYASMFNSFSVICKYHGIIKSNECMKQGITRFDLTKIFNSIEYEKNQGKFRPDLTLTNAYGQKIFIEIAVTHFCENEKIESKNKIIEINIENEADINIILERNISEENKKIKFYNFENFNVPVEPICDKNVLANYLVLLKDGRRHSFRVSKMELCKFIHEYNEIIDKITLMPTIHVPVMPSYNYNRGGPRINEIDSKINRPNYRKNNKFKRKR